MNNTPAIKDLGQIVATPGVLAAMEASGDVPGPFLIRHQLGDWGVVNHEDKKANDRALEDGSRIFSAYLLKDGTRIWIITEAIGENGKRASTCVLLPGDY